MTQNEMPRQTIEIPVGGFRDRRTAAGNRIRLYRHPNGVGAVCVIKASGATEQWSNALAWDDARALANAWYDTTE